MTQISIYLDHAATTPLSDEVASEISVLLNEPWSNPASLHRSGRQARSLLENAKDDILGCCLGPQAEPADWRRWLVIVTSGGTEANNLALRALRRPTDPLIVGATEHPSVLQPALMAPDLVLLSEVLPVSPATGQPNIDVLDAMLQRHDRSGNRPLVSIMVGNNETGLLHDLSAISRVCRQYRALLHTDAVQAFGKVDISAILPLVDALTISAHKLRGPVGVGALIVRESVRPMPIFFGGGQQLAVRPGTESLLLTSALATACRQSQRLLGNGGVDELMAKRVYFEKAMLEAIPGARLIGWDLPRLPHISCFAFPGWDRQALLMALDMAGIECSSGSACASGSSLPSHVLSAMELPEEWISSAIRFSLGAETTTKELDMAIERITDIFSKTK